MVYANIHLYYLNILMEVWKIGEKIICILLDTFNKNLTTISRGPNDMIFCFVCCMGAFAKSHLSSIP